MPPIRCVLFDFGNTLFAHASLPDTIATRAARLGARLDPTDAQAVAGRIDKAAQTPEELQHPRDFDSAVWMARWEVLYGLADEYVPALGAALLADMHDPLAWVPFQDSAATLRRLHAAGVAIGVVSNTGWDVRTAFRAHAMDTFVDHFTLSYEVGAVKPDPRIFLSACAELGHDPQATLMVGDDLRADSGAASTGMRVLLLPLVARGADNGVGGAADLVLGRC